MLAIDKALWSIAAFLGGQFLFIGWRVRYDRSYAYFGLCLLAVCLFRFAEVWPGPAGPAGEETGFWTPFARAVACATLPLLLLFLCHAGRVPLPRGFWIFLACVAAAAACFAWPAAYRIAVLPSALLFPALCHAALSEGARLRPPGESRRFLAFVFCGALLCAAVLADLLASAWDPPAAPDPLPAAVLFAAASVNLLLSRFLSLQEENRETMKRLGEAYAQLRVAKRFRELGASAAIISHEIRNYVSTLRGNALLMKRAGEGQAAPSEADRIGSTTERLEAVSRDISAYARASLALHRSPLSLEQMLANCVERNFTPFRDQFRIHAQPKETFVRGESVKLEQAFMNLFKNAIEASASLIEVRFRRCGGALIVAVEDDGKGCEADELPKIAEPFFSGKAFAGGSGLGCSIAKSIFKAHGASLRAYSKNLLGDGRTGMVLNMVFPLAEGGVPGEPARAGDILVAAAGPEARACMLEPLLNLGVRPMLLSETPAEEFEALRRPLLLVDRLLADSLLRKWHYGEAIIAEPFRVARRAAQGAAQAPFLLSEENLAERMPMENPA